MHHHSDAMVSPIALRGDLFSHLSFSQATRAPYASHDCRASGVENSLRRVPPALKQNRPFCFSRGLMREQPYDDLSLFGQSGSRKYLNAAERRRFIKKAECAVPDVRLFCLVLGWSGARISEVLALTPAAIDLDIAVANFELSSAARPESSGKCLCLTICLMNLTAVLICEPGNATAPAPKADLALEPRNSLAARQTGYGRRRHHGARATPKGLRHGFGVNAFQSNVPPHLCSTMARPCLAAHHLYIWRRDGGRGTRVCCAYVGEEKLSEPNTPLTSHSRMFTFRSHGVETI